MSPLVVLFAVVVARAAQASLVPALLAQPRHLPALVLDPHGRPLDTAEVISARALHLQAKALEGHHGLLGPVSLAAPHWAGYSAIASPWAGTHGHLLKKRSLGLAGLVHSIPVAHAIAPAAVSHQSRVDVISSPAIHTVSAPAVAAHAAPVVTAYAAPAISLSVLSTPALNAHSILGGISAHGLTAHGHYLKKRSLGYLTSPLIVPSAVSHQSRVDVHSSPAVLTHSVLAAPALSTHSILGGLSAHGHYLKKRSLGYLTSPLIVPSAVSHQSRVDVHSSPAVLTHSVLAAPALSTHSILGGLSAHGHYLKKRSLGYLTSPLIVPSAVSHQSRVDVHSSPAVISTYAAVAPIVSSVHASPSHYSHHGVHASPLLHSW